MFLLFLQIIIMILILGGMFSCFIFHDAKEILPFLVLMCAIQIPSMMFSTRESEEIKEKIEYMKPFF